MKESTEESIDKTEKQRCRGAESLQDSWSEVAVPSHPKDASEYAAPPRHAQIFGFFANFRPSNRSVIPRTTARSARLREGSKNAGEGGADLAGREAATSSGLPAPKKGCDSLHGPIGGQPHPSFLCLLFVRKGGRSNHGTHLFQKKKQWISILPSSDRPL